MKKQNLDKGLGRNGRTMKDVWREKGMTEEQIEERWQERIELIRAVKRRNYLRKLGIDAEKLGLDDGYAIARSIEKKRKEMVYEMGRSARVNPLKGVKKPTTLAREAEKRSKAALKKLERDMNPRFRTKGVEGLTPDADGKIGLREARKQRPDLFKMDNTDFAAMMARRGVDVSK